MAIGKESDKLLFQSTCMHMCVCAGPDSVLVVVMKLVMVVRVGLVMMKMVIVAVRVGLVVIEMVMVVVVVVTVG